MKSIALLLPLALALALLLTPPPAAADCFSGHCHINYGHGYINNYHYKPVVAVTPVAALLVPAFSFQYLPAVQVQPAAARATTKQAAPLRDSPRAVDPADNWPSVPVNASIGGSLADGAPAILKQACGKCHGQPARSGIELIDQQGSLLAGANAEEILRQVEDDLMPPKNPLSASQKDILRAALAR